MLPIDLPLANRVALVTGVTRPQGIGYAIAMRLSALGADLAVHSFIDYDRKQTYWDGSSMAGKPLAQSLLDAGHRVVHLDADLSQIGSAEVLFERALAEFTHIDILVLNHAADIAQGLGQLSDHDTDYIMSVNVRASLMLVQEFARQHESGTDGRVIMMTSGQDLGPMQSQLAYAASKGAISSLTRSLSDALVDQGITVNTVNPGPIDTGYATPVELEDTRRRFPGKKWGQPDDAARLIAWLCTDEARWITGQVINSEGGFRRN